MIGDRDTESEEISLAVAGRKISYNNISSMSIIASFSARTSIFTTEPPDQAQYKYSQHNQGLSMTKYNIKTRFTKSPEL